MLNLTDNNYEFHVQSGIVLVKFGAEWCGPCKMMQPVLNELEQDYFGQITIAEVNIDENPLITSSMKVKSIPAVFLYKNGNIVDKQIGAASKSFWRDKINKQLS